MSPKSDFGLTSPSMYAITEPKIPHSSPSVYLCVDMAPMLLCNIIILCHFGAVVKALKLATTFTPFN